jgi:hypothetical protein
VSEATLLRGEQSPAMLDRRLRCLEREREELEALVEVLAAADGVVAQHALDAAYGLPPSAACAAETVPAPDAPTTPELRARVQAAERALAQADALDRAGSDPAAVDIIDRTLVDARRSRLRGSKPSSCN